ncbi:MAG TPA: MFS transporter [Balneolaceae bacterium]|nr:MFS transporter [Balneolaceae bacterium]
MQEIYLNYLKFIRKEKRILSFGLSFSFLSSFGQTFFISLFVPYFLPNFSLSNGTFGTLYAIATLISAGSLPYLGKWIDHISLRKYSFFVIVGLLAASLMVTISSNIGMLFVGILLLRISGQGLSSHTARTTMARYFEFQRGRALSVSSLGYPIGEGILPLAVSGLLGILSWRTIWVVVMVLIILVFAPLIWFLLGEQSYELSGENSSKPKAGESSWPVYKMLFQDYRFWLSAPAVLLPPFWITGLFLYQVSVAKQLSWSAELIATAFVGFAVSRIISSLSVGPIIDHFSAESIFPFYLLPLAGGLVTAFYHPGQWSAFLYMILVGVTLGIGSNITSALWAELYGTKVLGTVRSLFSSLRVFGTAVCPLLMGWAIDRNMSMETIIFIAILSVAAATFLVFAAFWAPALDDSPEESFAEG